MIVVYSKDNCAYCEKAKALLEMKGYEYKVNKLGVDFEIPDLMEMFPGAKTFPQISEVGVGHIGGYTELESYILSKELTL
jgi:Glutaredoxin and related proteins